MAGGTNADGLGQQIPGCHSRRMYGPSGYLASSTTQRYGVGGLKCPWEVSLQPGQRVTLHLYDYTEHTTRQRHHPGFSNSPNSQQPKCPIYAMVMDDTHLEYIRVCGNERRGQKVYTSTSNYVHITVVNVSEQLHQRNFMLKYQGMNISSLSLSLLLKMLCMTHLAYYYNVLQSQKAVSAYLIKQILPFGRAG